MSRAAVLATVVLGVLARGAPVSADVTRIDFDFTGSTITALGGAITIPSDGSIDAASGSLFVQATSATAVVPGQIFLSDLLLDVTIDGTVLGLADITGFVVASQIGFAFGTLSTGLMSALFTSSLTLTVNGVVDCTPPAVCGLVGTFPAILSGEQIFTANQGVTIAANNVSVNGAASVSAVIPFDLAGQTAVVTLIGAEVDRTFVPEPGRLLQLAGAGAGLLVAAWWRRRRVGGR